jgi:hypothetical protein
MIKAGASQVKITPCDSQFLFGYPHVKRYSTGVHDDLWTSALYIENGREQVIFIANDIIFVSKEVTAQARKAVSQITSVKTENIMITATHTHSGPHTVDYISNASDNAVPKADQKYVDFMKDSIIKAGVEAFNKAQPAKAGFALADDTGVGTNRREPDGPADHQVPVMILKNIETQKYIACMLVCSMHPTVMHEDSTLVSADFPGMSRMYLQENLLGSNCPVLHHTGPSGNQSPRHVTRANTFDEAKRLGEILAKAVQKAVENANCCKDADISSAVKLIYDLPPKKFPSVSEAEDNLANSIKKLESLKKSNASKQNIRTAECDWFGAEETLTLAKAQQSHLLKQARHKSLPAEIQIIKIADFKFVAWPGEVFIEYALEVKKNSPNTFVISLANGELQGYIVTAHAAQEAGYEASNALFNHKAGNILVQNTLQLLKEL